MVAYPVPQAIFCGLRSTNLMMFGTQWRFLLAMGKWGVTLRES